MDLKQLISKEIIKGNCYFGILGVNWLNILFGGLNLERHFMDFFSLKRKLSMSKKEIIKIWTQIK